MKIVVFGLSISSAWGNGHATLLRGLFRALHGNGHEVHFFERDVPYYAAHRDATSLPYVNLYLYADWSQVLQRAELMLADADVGIVTSYCPDGVSASDLMLSSGRGLRTIFYDMDTPVTLDRLERGETVEYLPSRGLGFFDLVLSYTGGEAIRRLKNTLGARHVVPFYGWVDPEMYYRVQKAAEFSADLSYLGTYAADRQHALEELLITPARQLGKSKFIIAGAMHEQREAWPGNIRYFGHVSPPQHSLFYSSSLLTLNVTRGTMAAMGYCPSGRLFEAAACGSAVMSDEWEGLDTFFEPDREILIAGSAAEAVTIITEDREKLETIGARARERTLECHTAQIRARQLVDLIENPPEGIERDVHPGNVLSMAGNN